MAKRSIIFPDDIVYIDDDVDDHHLYLQKSVVSDYEFAETLQLEETIIFSRQNLSNTHKRKSIIEDGSIESSYKRNKSWNESSESSSNRICEICTDEKQDHDMFRVQNCSHSFCSTCISTYISVKLQQNVAAVTCLIPDCKGMLDLDTCKAIIPLEVADRWGKALAESIIPDTEKFYCPFMDCSAVMIQEAAMKETREAECLECHRLFCAQCRSPWHAGKTCSEFQKGSADGSEREDSLFKSLAEEKQWAICPNCKSYVEKMSGCAIIHCRCKHVFSYVRESCSRKQQPPQQIFGTPKIFRDDTADRLQFNTYAFQNRFQPR